MPFNVEPPCIAPSKTIITWQFPGQDVKKNSQGDDYRVYYGVPANAPRRGVQVRYNVDTFATDSFLGECYADVNSLEPNYKQISISNVRELPPDPLGLFVELEPTSLLNGVPQYVPGLSPGWRIRAKTYLGITGNVPAEQILYAGTGCSGFYVVPGSLRNVEYVFQPGYEVKYVVEIYRGGGVILADVGDGLPFVSYECGELEECPPDTCSVDCGTYVCCYGSDGISVFNFQKI